MQSGKLKSISESIHPKTQHYSETCHQGQITSSSFCKHQSKIQIKNIDTNEILIVKLFPITTKKINKRFLLFHPRFHLNILIKNISAKKNQTNPHKIIIPYIKRKTFHDNRLLIRKSNKNTKKRKLS